MEEKKIQLRVRDVAHLWGDKRVLRFFRKNFEKIDYKPLRNVYLALCEIDSDFVEERNSKTKHLHALTKTCSTYAGMDISKVTETLQFLKFIDLIDYGRKIGEGGKTIGSFLIMYKWEGENFHLQKIDTFMKENPNKEESLYGAIGMVYKNIINNRFVKNVINYRLKQIFYKEKINVSATQETNPPVLKNPFYNKEHLQKDNPLQEEAIPTRLERVRRPPQIDRSEIKRQLHPKKEKVPIPLESVPEELLLWKSLNLVQHKTEYVNKTYALICKTIMQLKRGSFFSKKKGFEKYERMKFSQEQIVDTIQWLGHAANDPNYEPINKKYLKGLSFVDFFYNERVVYGDASLFIQYFENPPKKRSGGKPRDNRHIQVVNRLKKIYCKEVLGTDYQNNGLSEVDLDKFDLATERVLKLLQECGSELCFPVDGLDFAEMLHKALVEQFGEKSLGPGNYCSNYTFSTIFPRYLFQQAVVRTDFSLPGG